MKILVIDRDVVGLDFILRCMAYDHEVRWFLPKEHNGKQSRAGDGMDVLKVEDWREEIDWADLIVPTVNQKDMYHLDVFRRSGYPIFGPSYGSTQLEIDRVAGMQILEEAGFDLLPYKEFNDYNEAIEYVKKRDCRLVSKPLDSDDKALSYVAPSPEAMVYMLQRWRDSDKDFGPFILQDYCEGVEMGVSRWLGRSGWVGPFNESFEFKKLMPGNMGVNTGETGTIMQYTQKSKLGEEMLAPLEKALMELGHTGDTAMNFMIPDDGKPKFMEWTCRLGWPEFYIMQAMHKGDPAQWMLDSLNGQDTLKTHEDVAIGFLIWIPDFPYSHATQKEVEGIPIYGITDEMMPHIHLAGAMLGKAPVRNGTGIVNGDHLLSAGDYLLVVSARGKTVIIARDKAIDLAENIRKSMPNDPAYRNDIGDDKFRKKLNKLHSMGYATSMEYGDA